MHTMSDGLDLDDYRTVVIALTGPPAAGKSTATTMLRDMGVPCMDTGEAIRSEARDRHDQSDPDEEYVWNVAELIREEHGAAGPTAITADWIEEQRRVGNEVICISSLREQAEVDWLRNNVGPTLVVRIDANKYTRCERYAERELDSDDRESVDTDRVTELHEELFERELRESPYPDHDVQIRNEDSVRLNQLWRKLENVVTVADA